MSPDLTMNIASVSKTLTAVAILQLLTKNGLTPDAKISPYIYGDWTQGPNINQITFKELLTHTSGLGKLSGCADGITYDLLKKLVKAGVVLKQHAKINSALSSFPRPAAYGNCNFALLRELMPALMKQSVGSGNDTQRAQNSMTFYINYMRQNVFAPLGIPATRDCKPPPLNMSQILSYPFTPGSVNGENFGDETMEVNGEGTCGPSGWSLSANDVFAVINDLATGNMLLTNNQKQQMTSFYLGWDDAVRAPDCPAPNLCKNGVYAIFRMEFGSGLTLVFSSPRFRWSSS